MAEELDLGTPGASGRREHERRRAKREEKTHERHPHIGGVLLRLRGRDKTKLIHGLARQADAVRAASGGTEVHACLCFVGGNAELPLLRKLSIDGYRLLYPKALANWLDQPGELGAEEMRALAEALARALPSA
jgi:hypothetical protein